MIYPILAFSIVLSIYSAWAWYTDNDFKYTSTLLSIAMLSLAGYLYFIKEDGEIETYENEKVSLGEIKSKVDTLINSS